MPIKAEYLQWLSEPLRESVVEFEGKQFRLREMTEEQRTLYELALQDNKGKMDYSKARRLMIAYMLVDDDGNRIIDDESQLKSVRGSIAGALFDECQKLNAYKPDEVKEIVKNSEEVPA